MAYKLVCTRPFFDRTSGRLVNRFSIRTRSSISAEREKNFVRVVMTADEEKQLATAAEKAAAAAGLLAQ
jgi:hypothetical protein